MKTSFVSLKSSLALVALLACGTAIPLSFAEEDSQARGDCERHQQRGGKMRHHRNFFGGGNREEMMARQLNADQIRTLAEARLIMKGNENLQVGDVSSTGSGFHVTIVTQDNSLVKELDLAHNGMPLKMYEKIQQRMEQRQAEDE